MSNYSYDEIKNIYGKISPFEFKDKLIDIAKYNSYKNNKTLLDAGRGNPNWTASTPREAFFTFGYFAISETKLDWCIDDLAGMPQKNNISFRFYDFVKNNSNLPGIDLLKNIIDHGINTLGFDPDDFLHELTDAIIGDNYPYPDKMLPHIEKIVHDYLVKEMKYDIKNGGDLSIFAVEGATAAMCYTFDSLVANELLRPKDKIAIMTPIFTPYLEIPHLPKYNFEVVNICADEVDEDGEYTYQYSKKELSKLCDTDIKALFVVNPNNPASIAIDDNCANNLVNIIKNNNPDLMIISDDVYGTFINDFTSLMAKLPFNTIGAYSYSKYFGVTGWRLGTIALHENNVFDKKIKELPSDLKELVNKRYKDMSLNPESISFMDRMVADSRSVALNHTAGLSTPQQVQMAFFSAFALLDTNDNYKKLNIEICNTRKALLFEALEIELKQNVNDASYYVQFDIEHWAHKCMGYKFVDFIKNSYHPVDMLYKLAAEHSIVLLSGSGFAGPDYSIRVSLANLKNDDYKLIGKAISQILEEYKNSFNEFNRKCI